MADHAAAATSLLEAIQQKVQGQEITEEAAAPPETPASR